ncbi:hypothetical protein BT67DRAFT_21708 [Trichocladium antarcticum]|uniref:Uncharacterized protein n=1 Tax=Trichocladium antarcticum TaxID=1450529 RepID=A0AAN6ZIK3_9PEZI|nr:hypothetical protein BT67DRAFT_21708 [Trichocladium antarcticum]
MMSKLPAAVAKGQAFKSAAWAMGNGRAAGAGSYRWSLLECRGVVAIASSSVLGMCLAKTASALNWRRREMHFLECVSVSTNLGSGTDATPPRTGHGHAPKARCRLHDQGRSSGWERLLIGCFGLRHCWKLSLLHMLTARLGLPLYTNQSWEMI